LRWGPGPRGTASWGPEREGVGAVSRYSRPAAGPPTTPAGVVAATVLRICFQQPGLLFLVASARKCSINSSASGSAEFALRTALMALFHTEVSSPTVPLDGAQAHNIVEISLSPCSIAKA